MTNGPVAKARRVSYIVPPPTSRPKRLLLPPLDVPRHGRTTPLLILAPEDRASAAAPETEALNAGSYFGQSSKAPQHRLGVTALALDATTQLAGHSNPEGILYSGGRDGLIIAWEQNTPMRRRTYPYGCDERTGKAMGRWEVMTGWDDDFESDEDDEDSDGWVDGAPNQLQDTIPFEDRWEPDYENMTDHRSAVFRQCVQSHTDWINDIVLCNMNRTVVSASNDGTIKAWNPHGVLASDRTPSVIGDHMDYVRCVAYARDRNWVASGSFDQTIKLWDLQHPHSDPLTTLSLPDAAASAKASVYALATHPEGHSVVAGSPERVVRVWDPRSGKRTMKLVGHTDNIRSLILSDDGKYLLSGSSDASIKLWSLTAQKCLHTFNHHLDSVWTLFSNHPTLDIFYSGDRSGLVCKVDVEGCTDLSEGECVLICKDAPDQEEGRAPEGVNKVVALDDLDVWTATGSSTFKRWSQPIRRALRRRDQDELRAESPPPMPSLLERFSSASGSPVLSRSTRRDDLMLAGERASSTQRAESPPMNAPRSISHQPQHPRYSTQSTVSGVGTIQNANNAALLATMLHGLPYESLLRLVAPHDTYPRGALPRMKDAEIATLYSAASIRSVPAQARTLDRQTLPTLLANLKSNAADDTSSPPSITSPQSITSPDGLPQIDAARDAYEERELAADAVPLYAKPNDVIQGTHGLIRAVLLNSRLHALTVDTAGEVAVWDLVQGQCLGVYSSEDVGSASNAGSTVSGHSAAERSPREALETVTERIEGEAIVAAWASVDTKIGHLTVHLVEGRCFDAEVYPDELGFLDAQAFPEEHKINVGKWILSNLFSEFVKGEMRLMVQQANAPQTDTKPRDTLASSGGIVRGSAPAHINLAPTEGRRLRSASDLSTAMRTPGARANGTAALTPAVLVDLPSMTAPSGRATPVGTPALSGVTKVGFVKDHTLTPIPASPVAIPPTPGTSTATRTPGTMTKEGTDYFAGRGRARSSSVVTEVPDEVPGGGGFMGRLRHFGKNAKKQGTEVAAPAISEGKDAAPSEAVEENASLRMRHLKALNEILSQPLTPTPDVEAPRLQLPSETAVMISEEAADASGWMGVYTSLVSMTQDDLEAVEMAAPVWLLELILLNKSPTPTLVKVSFIVVAWHRKDEAIAESSRLTAGRTLRVKKVLHYVRDKFEPLDIKAAKAKASPRHSTSTAKTSEAPGVPNHSLEEPSLVEGTDANARPEDVYELICNDVVLPITMTIGAANCASSVLWCYSLSAYKTDLGTVKTCQASQFPPMLLITVLSALALSLAPTVLSAAVKRSVPAGFVTTLGMNFELDGKHFDYLGANSFWLPLLSTTTDVDKTFAGMQAEGVRVVRTWGFNAINTTELATAKATNLTYYQVWSPDGTYAINIGPQGLERLDYVVQTAGKYGIKLIINFTNDWIGYGGINLYLQNMLGASATQDLFYTNAEVIASFYAYIKIIVDRYKSSPNVFAWEVANELRCLGQLPSGPACVPGSNTLYNFYKKTTDYIRSLDPYHMITTGGEGHFYWTNPPHYWSDHQYVSDYNYNGQAGEDFDKDLTLPNIDFGVFHLYPQSWYPELDFPGSNWTAQEWGQTWIEQHAASARRNNKPVVLEEFGVTGLKNQSTVYPVWAATALANGVAGIMPWQFGQLGLTEDGGNKIFKYADALINGASPNDGYAIYPNETSVYNLLKAVAVAEGALLLVW
ncbi:hypothetical protein FRB96_003304 [Tulasnella sp. 330]|nr:hypothetical protein FRB96_003304 [Tulasnella sp. 330]